MFEEDLISVIIPVYCVEKYLDKCVQSIIEQTYNNLEIILVDDGSPDRSGEMCDAWRLKDDRINVIHKQNGGLSSARNSGIEIASGQWIVLIDSDDYVAPYMIEKLYVAVKSADAALGICNYMYVDENGKGISEKNYYFPVKDEVLTGLDTLNKLFEDRSVFFITAVNKIYKKELLDKIRFPIGKIHEDEYTAHLFLGESERVACISDICYFYVQRAGSIMNSESLGKNINKYKVEAHLYRAIYANKKKLIKHSGTTYYCAYKEYAKLTALKNSNYSDLILLREKLNQNFFLANYCSGKHRAVLWALRLLPCMMGKLLIDLDCKRIKNVV